MVYTPFAVDTGTRRFGVMANMAGFIIKVFGASLLLSLAIKYGGPYLPIAGTTTTALIAVLTPSIVVAIVLGWRWQQRSLL